MKTAEDVELSEAQIAVHWREEEYFYPPAKFIGQANASDPAIFERFREENFPECFKEYADLLTWDKYWHTTLDTINPPFWKWFVGRTGVLTAIAAWYMVLAGVMRSTFKRQVLPVFPI